MKRILSLVICFAIMVSIPVSSFAAKDSDLSILLNGHHWGDSYDDVKETIPYRKLSYASSEDSPRGFGLIIEYATDDYFHGTISYYFKYDSLYAVVMDYVDPTEALDKKLLLDSFFGKGHKAEDQWLYFSAIFHTLEDTTELDIDMLDEMLEWVISDSSSILLADYKRCWYLVAYDYDYYKMAS